MISICFGVLIRIVSNSCINVFQKMLTYNNKSSVINFYTYLGLSVISLFLLPTITIVPNKDLLINFICMGCLGALGNYFIVKSLSMGDLSSLAPINSYKPIVAMIFAFVYLKEVPSLVAIMGILLIIAGTYMLYNKQEYNKKALLLRFLALLCSGTEAVFIKRIILLTNISASFVLWAFSGLFFSLFFIKISNLKIDKKTINILFFLVLSACFMQLSTNFVFSRMEVSLSLALFQLSTILSVFLGVNIFKEKNLLIKAIASVIMILGAITIIFS